MPIGVNYTGMDGRTVRGSLPSLRGSLQSLRGSLVSVRDANRADGRNAEPPKLAMGASLRNVAGGLKLDGDERNTQHVRNGTGMYGKVNGRKTWLGLDDVDPRNNGAVIGDPTSNSTEEQQDNRASVDTAPFTDSSISRIVFKRVEAKKNEETDEVEEPAYIEVWAYYRERSLTGEGRTFAVSGERKVFVGTIMDGDTEPFETEEVDVVDDVWLDNSGAHPTLKQTKRKVKILKGSSTKKTIWTVFEATPHVDHDAASGGY